MYVYMYIYIYVYICICVYICLYIYIYVMVGWLVESYGISTFVGYLMPNPFFLQIKSSISNNSA